MNRRAGPPSQLPTLTEVVGDAAPPPGFVVSTSGARLLDESVRLAATPEAGMPKDTSTLADANARSVQRAGSEQREANAGSPGANVHQTAPPIRQALTRKPRTPLGAPAAGAGSQLPLLGVPIDAVPAAAEAGGPARDVEPGLGPDIFENSDQAPLESGDDQLVRAVLQDLQRHVDLMLEYRLRASLTPLLTQLADTLVRDLRQELASTLRDVVKRAVNQELVRRRKR